MDWRTNEYNINPVYAPVLCIFRWIGGPINLMKTIIKDNIEQVRRYNRGQNVCVVNPGIKHGYGLDKFLLDILRTFGYPTDFCVDFVNLERLITISDVGTF